MFWKKKRKQLSEISVDESGKIVDQNKEDFTIENLIELLQVGAILLSKFIEYTKDEKKGKK